MLKNWCFWTAVLEKTLESPMESKDMKSVNPKGNQSWIFIGRNDDEAEAPILWPPDAKSIHWKILWCSRGWDGWIVSLTQWTWVWANSRRYWRTEKPGVLQSMGLQRFGHDWATEQQLNKWFWLLHQKLLFSVAFFFFFNQSVPCDVCSLSYFHLKLSDSEDFW